MTTQLHVWGYTEGCPSCTRIKELFDNLGVPYVFHAIDRGSPERAALRDAGFATVPQVFTPEGLHVGDYQVFRKAAVASITALTTP